MFNVSAISNVRAGHPRIFDGGAATVTAVALVALGYGVAQIMGARVPLNVCKPKWLVGVGTTISASVVALYATLFWPAKAEKGENGKTLTWAQTLGFVEVPKHKA